MGKPVYITEKPSVAASFAGALGLEITRADKGRGYAENQDAIVTWCFGHLVTLAFPEAYDPALKAWNVAQLPIIPKEYKYVVIDEKGARQQFEVVSRLLCRKDVDVIYSCTDSGREGEYIFRLVYRQSGSDKPARRVWISAQTEEAIKRGIAEAKDISAYDSLAKAAYCRAQEDWLFGMNFSRLYTCRYGQELSRQLGEAKSSVIAIGRVMTCVLGLVAQRELEIRHFVPKKQYGVLASFLSVENGIAWQGRWLSAALDGSRKGLTAETARAGETESQEVARAEGTEFQGSACTKEEAEALVEKLRGLPGQVKKVESKVKKEPPPLLFNLAELQAEVNRRYKIPVDRVLEITQSLYEKKLVSYPRTDSRVLSTEVVPELPKILNGLYGNTAYREAALRIKSFGKLAVDEKSRRFVDDGKVTDHYAIIPTYVTQQQSLLEPDQEKVYNLIVRRFLAIFYPPAEFNTVRVETEVGTELFVTNAKTLKSPGWREVYEIASSGKEDKAPFSASGTKSLPSPGDSHVVSFPSNEGVASQSPIHLLVRKQPCDVTSLGTEEKESKPPPRFTEGSLILTMEKAGKYIENEELRNQMKTSGIGTAATRSGIIKKLYSIRYIQVHAKSQVVTPTRKGEGIVELVRQSAKELLNPTLTASWEKGLLMIQNRETTEEVFTGKLTQYITKTIDKVKRGQEPTKPSTRQ